MSFAYFSMTDAVKRWAMFFLCCLFCMSAYVSGEEEINSCTSSATSVQEEKKKICLTMIVKNESRIIERCLLSVKDIVDCISICDTGSSDNTVAIIEQFLVTHGIPGKVHQHDWKNFGHNRTLSVQAAQGVLKELGFVLSDTYLLLLDADMLLEVSPQFDRKTLCDDSYLVLQQSDSLSYYNTRLINASLSWECRGVTHEYWACVEPNRSSTQLHALVINDREDGGCKADKFERDVRLLTQGLEEEPDNARYMFYLAQSYLCLGRYEEAIAWYCNRIARGGWDEEVWYSRYMIGECYERLGQWDQALSWYLEAYQHHPTRAETLYRIANYYRCQEQYHLAHLFAKQGIAIPYPKKELLFISHAVYTHELDEELAISAYYTPFREEGLAASNRLILKKEVPEEVKQRAYSHLRFYLKPLRNSMMVECKPKDDISPADIHNKEGAFIISQFSSNKENQPHQESLTVALRRITPVSRSSSYDLSSLKYATSAIPFEGHFLAVAYEDVEGEQGFRHHRLILLDDQGKIMKYSKPFVFLSPGKEWCGDFACDESGKWLTLQVKASNEKTYRFFLPISTVNSELEPLVN